MLVGPRVLGAGAPASLKIEQPFHGAILNRRHGLQVDNGLKVVVRGTAPLGDAVSINGAPAQRAGGGFESKIVIRQKQSEIVAVSTGILGQQEHRIRVIWDRYSYPRYRFSIDDNSFFLRDIARKDYPSLFDCFYLKGLALRQYFLGNAYYPARNGFTGFRNF